MGYRLDIYKKEDRTINRETDCLFYGTKLFGYCKNNELDSFKYLVELNKCNENIYFDYGLDIEIELTHDEFIKFITLYAEDYKKFWGEDKEFNLFDEEPELKECLNYKGNFVISWG